MLAGLRLADEGIASCLHASAWALPESDLIGTLDAVHALEQRLAALKLALVREIDGRGTPVAHGASSTAVWLRERLHLSIRAARRLVGDADAINAAPAAVRAALAKGVVTSEQARAVADTVATVHDQAGAAAAQKATHLLLDWAAQFDPPVLQRLGERILFHVAPEIAADAERRLLAAAEERAERHRHVTLSALPDGRVRLTGSLDSEAAALFRAAIEPLCAPTGADDGRSPGQRRHDALADICRLALRTGDLPDHGGDVTQVVVTTSFEPLVGRLAAGSLDTGLRLAPETVRRLACDANILPAVLGGNGQVLDLGRQRRLIAGPLRRALVLRDRGCAFPGCDRPPRWAEGHHIVHWADGGETSLRNSVLLCRAHHRQIHHHGWSVRLANDGRPEFLPPAWLDPEQRPRRNAYHQRC
ncbi:MAG TPA: DUF222 domain-containing protein [Micromonosporaceae bacterium]